MRNFWLLEIKTRRNHGYIIWSDKGGGGDENGNIVLAENDNVIFRKDKKALLEYLIASNFFDEKLEFNRCGIHDGGFYDYSISPARMIGLLKGRRAKYILDLLNLASDIALSINSHEVDFIQSSCSIVGKVMDEITIYGRVRSIQLLFSDELKKGIFDVLRWVENKMVVYQFE